MVRKLSKPVSSGVWCVYMLRCSDGTFYTGISNHLRRRVNDHNTNNALGARYTRARRPVLLVYSEQSENRSTATIRERKIKHLSRTAKRSLINSASHQPAKKIN